MYQVLVSDDPVAGMFCGPDGPGKHIRFVVLPRRKRADRILREKKPVKMINLAVDSFE
jgi:hypothetical protein